MELQTAKSELPRWKCHKEVHAFKITGIRVVPESKGALAIITGDEVEVEVTGEYMKKHRPQIGGYLVQYEDNYLSFSPAPAFESGYSRIPVAYSNGSR